MAEREEGEAMSDTPRTDDVRHNVAELGMFARQLERELNEAKRSIRTLIQERDSARIQADHKWRLREEFEVCLERPMLRSAWSG